MRQRIAVFTTAAAAALAIACGGGTKAPEPANAPASPSAPTPPTAGERVAWYQDCWRLYNTKAWDRFANCYATSAESDQVDSGQPPARGRDAIVAATKPFVTAFPDVAGRPQVILVNGNQLASIHVLTGTHTGPLAAGGGKPLDATGKPIGMYFGHALEMDPATNSVIREWGFAENGTLMSQLGVSKAPARPATTTAAAKCARRGCPPAATCRTPCRRRRTG